MGARRPDDCSDLVPAGVDIAQLITVSIVLAGLVLGSGIGIIAAPGPEAPIQWPCCHGAIGLLSCSTRGRMLEQETQVNGRGGIFGFLGRKELPADEALVAAWNSWGHPLFMAATGVYTMVSCTRNSRRGTCFSVALLCGALITVTISVIFTVFDAAPAAPGCCPCAFNELLMREGFRNDFEFWVGAGTATFAPLISLIHYLVTRPDDALVVVARKKKAKKGAVEEPTEDEEEGEPIDLEALFDQLDADGNGYIQFDELMELLGKQHRSASLVSLKNSAVLLFASLDRNGDGMLSRAEMQGGLASFATRQLHDAFKPNGGMPSPPRVELAHQEDYLNGGADVVDEDRYPFPADVDENRLLHVARIEATDGYGSRGDGAEPRCTVLLSPDLIVGLENFDSLYPLPTLYVTVPSGWSHQRGAVVNPGIEPTEQMFQILDGKAGRDPTRVVVPVRTLPPRAYDHAAMRAAPLGWS